MPDPKTLDDILDEAREKMSEALEHLRAELRTLRTGRASPAMLENLRVDYYGSKTPITQVASISAPQADLLLVQPYDNNALEDIERAIMQADLGLNPNNDGQTIRVPVPPLSEERREEMVTKAQSRGEETKISIRNARREAKDAIKALQQKENLSEDARYSAEQELQDVTDEHTDEADVLLEQKEDDIMTV
jgi:ribosome recycling factor